MNTAYVFQGLSVIKNVYPAQNRAETWVARFTGINTAHSNKQAQTGPALHACVSNRSQSTTTDNTSDQSASLSWSSNTSSNTDNDVDHREDKDGPVLFPAHGGIEVFQDESTDEIAQEQVEPQPLDEMGHKYGEMPSLYINDGKTLNPLLAPFIGAKLQHDPAKAFWQWSYRWQRFYHADDQGKIVLWYPRPESFA